MNAAIYFQFYRVESLRVLLLLCLCLFANILPAAEVSGARARMIASNAWKQFSADNPEHQSAAISFNDPLFIMHGNYRACYVFNETGGNGFVIVAADDRVTPLLGFSFSGKYTGEDQPSAFSWFISSMVSQLYRAVSGNIPAPASVSAEWEHFTREPFQVEKSGASVNPLLSTTWDQGCYYNDSCPVSSSSYHCHHVVTGCVATAMAQVLKYWKFPPYGLESHSYQHSVYGNQSANFRAARYVYDSMPGQVVSMNPYVAQLMYHCGVAVNMNYGEGSSAADIAFVDAAFRNYFGYSSTAHWQMRNNTDSAQWGVMLRSELDQGCPLVYYGGGNGDSHLFVCDGYHGDNFFHFNWGWSGNYDGYYYVNALTPDYFDFSNYQAAIFGLFPVSVPGVLWDQVGNPGFTPSHAYIGGLKVNSAGIPFVACRPLAADSVLVYKFNGVSWELVGKTVPAPGSLTCRLQFDYQDIPYILFSDLNSKPTIMKFNGSNWVAAGDPLPVTYGNQADMVFDSHNSLYVSLMANDQGTTYGYVYRQENGSWSEVGHAPFSTSQNLPEWARVALDTLGHVYVLYSDGADGFHAKVAEFDGTSWSLAGNGNVCSMSTQYDNAITVGDGNKVYVCLTNESVCRIYRYDSPGWTQIGGGDQGFQGGYPGLSADNKGNLYFGFVDMQQATRGSVMKYRDDQWTTEGPAGFTAGTATSSRLAVAKDGTIYYAYEDLCLDNRISVQKYRDPSYGTGSRAAGNPGWKLSPNPCTGGKIFLDGPSAQSIKYTITDMKGRLVFEGSADTPSSSAGSYLTIPPVLKGMFIVRITTEKGTSALKLIVECNMPNEF